MRENVKQLPLVSTILAVKKVGHLNRKTKMASEYPQRVFARQPIRTRVVVFMLRWPAYLTASIALHSLYTKHVSLAAVVCYSICALSARL